MASDVRGIYQSTAPTLVDGQQIQFQVSSDGSLKIASTTSVVATGGGVTWTDKTITSLSGSSQTLIAANASRKGIMIKNGDTNAAVNILGGTAAIGGAGCMTFQAYEGITIIGAECPVGAITVIGTAAKYVSAFEAT